MNLNLLILDGYGLYVWPAYIFTFIICFILYLKTKKEFQKQEKLFLKEFKQPQIIGIGPIKQKEDRDKEKVLSDSLIF